MNRQTEIITVDTAAAQIVRSATRDLAGKEMRVCFRFPIEDGRPLLSQRSSIQDLLVFGVMSAVYEIGHTFVQLSRHDDVSTDNLKPPRLEALSLSEGRPEILNARFVDDDSSRKVTAVGFLYNEQSQLYSYCRDVSGISHEVVTDEVMRQFAFMTLSVAAGRIN